MKKKLTQIQIDRLPVTITKEDNGLFVIESPVLDIVTQGKTIDLAKSRFEELVAIFFEEILESDTLDTVLMSLGWSKVSKKWQPPVVVESGLQEINFPARLSHAEA